jgi:hypothetical protein
MPHAYDLGRRDGEHFLTSEPVLRAAERAHG